MALRIAQAAGDFSNWSELLQLLRDAFAFMDGRIDPPSSVHRLTPTSLATKSREETLFLATDDDELVGCVFARRQGDAVYVSKLAVRSDRRRKGIGRRLMDAVEEGARQIGVRDLELETRLELTENHETFAAMGFVKVGEHAHEGYDHPTFMTMRKQLSDSRRVSGEARRPSRRLE
jgi:ribosomal protein S18 acetylase RimI-like enzyme